jgi:hypothetical protein
VGPGARSEDSTLATCSGRTGERMVTPGTLRLLKVLLAFLGVGALAGGAQFILAPDGRIIGMSSDLLAGSPFPDYLIPGILLFVVHGVLPLVNVYALTRRPIWGPMQALGDPFGRHWSFTTTLIQGPALMIWVTVEMLIFGVHWLMLFYGVLGLAILVLTVARSTRNVLALPRRSARAQLA